MSSSETAMVNCDVDLSKVLALEGNVTCGCSAILSIVLRYLYLFLGIYI